MNFIIIPNGRENENKSQRGMKPVISDNHLENNLESLKIYIYLCL